MVELRFLLSMPDETLALHRPAKNGKAHPVSSIGRFYPTASFGRASFGTIIAARSRSQEADFTVGFRVTAGI